MNMRHVLVAAFLLAPLARPQDSEFALLVKTSNPLVAMQVQQSFAKDPAAAPEMPPELAPGEHYVRLVDPQGAVTSVTGKGDVGVVQLKADPRALMSMFAAEVEQAKAMMNMMVSMQAAGADPAALAAMIDGLFAIPGQ